MICENCVKKDATIHLTEIGKNIKSESHLCEHCARDIRINFNTESHPETLQEMLYLLDYKEIKNARNFVCMNCGMSISELKKDKRFGCPQCYNYFNKPVKSIVSYHGKETKHIGKIPHKYLNDNLENFADEIEVVAVEEIITDNNISDLREKLKSAVTEERYEEAAIIRDLVKELESVK